MYVVRNLCPSGTVPPPTLWQEPEVFLCKIEEIRKGKNDHGLQGSGSLAREIRKRLAKLTTVFVTAASRLLGHAYGLTPTGFL